jgi:ribonucleoside-triphosphate reductase (thioredoxin)
LVKVKKVKTYMNNNPFPSFYEEFIYKSRYARWLDDEGRRENWDETVHRYLGFMKSHLKKNYDFYIPDELYQDLFDNIYSFQIMPSMRALMTAGPALERDNTAGFNCSYLPVDDVKSFDEAMYILMCGTGVGFSVERQYVQKLPEIPEKLFPSETVIVVRDSKEGWAKAYRQLIALLYSGEIPQWNVDKVRSSGERLKTFGGRASGSAPLEDLFRFTVAKFRGAQGRKLNSIECHDLMCKIGEIVVVGGVRRSALISLSNLSDDRMRQAKSGEWSESQRQRALANNSVSYTEKPDVGSFFKEWTSLYESKSGERGVFNRVAAQKQAAKNGRRDPDWEFGTNPCSEIILRPYQFCNLTEVVVKEMDTIETLKYKVTLATFLGTFQSTLTNFPYLRSIWRENTEEERLLGVSLTGIMDNPVMANSNNGFAFDDFGRGEGLSEILDELRKVAVDSNERMAKEVGISVSTAITCVKPSGTVSQLVNSASGIHGRYSPFYIRSVRADSKDPLTQFLKDSGVPNEPCVMKKDSVTVFNFPVKSPEGSVMASDQTAIEQLEHWLVYQRHWCEHKPSVTVYVKEHEWPEVGAWVWNHFDEVSGVSFLPYSDHTYKQAPYQPCSEEEYLEAVSKMPESIDWEKLSEYEKEDNTVGMQTMACSGGHCEIVDLT